MGLSCTTSTRLAAVALALEVLDLRCLTGSVQGKGREVRAAARWLRGVHGCGKYHLGLGPDRVRVLARVSLASELPGAQKRKVSGARGIAGGRDAEMQGKLEHVLGMMLGRALPQS